MRTLKHKIFIKNNLSSVSFLFCFLLFSSCSGFKNSQHAIHLDKSYCNKQKQTIYTQADLPKPLYELDIDTVLKNRFSNTSLNMANAIGILDILTDYTKLLLDSSHSSSLEKRIAILEHIHQIDQKINFTSLEISAIASELDCEEERTNQFASYLKERESQTEKGLVIGSIIVGAAGAITAEVVAKKSSNDNLVTGFTIGTSLVETSLGVLMLVNKRKIDFKHSDNALTDIWNNSTVSSYFPPSIWYYLTYENPNTKEKSLAKLLVEKWFLFGQVEEESSNPKDNNNKLYFGNGGQYGADELDNRADMLDQTESYVTLMKQDLKTLMAEIAKLDKK